MEIYIKRKIRIPTIPNFILTDGDEDRQSLPLKTLSKQEAEEIAELWKKEFMKKAGY